MASRFPHLRIAKKGLIIIRLADMYGHLLCKSKSVNRHIEDLAESLLRRLSWSLKNKAIVDRDCLSSAI